MICDRARQTKCPNVTESASGSEVAAAHKQNGRGFAIFTPVILMDETPTNNHKLVLKPEQALCAGADCLVVERPILAAPSGQEALKDLCAHTMSCTAPVSSEAWKPSGQNELPFKAVTPFLRIVLLDEKEKLKKQKCRATGSLLGR